MENHAFVHQKRQEILEILAAHAHLLSRQGSVQESWRTYQGVKQGPYFRLLYRQHGKQVSIYLGADQALAQEVRQALQELQAPLQQQRALNHLRKTVRLALRGQKRELDGELRLRGAYLKGFEIRGRRPVAESH